MVKSHLALREVAFLNELQTMGVEVFIRTRISQMNANVVPAGEHKVRPSWR